MTEPPVEPMPTVNSMFEWEVRELKLLEGGYKIIICLDDAAEARLWTNWLANRDEEMHR
jgi:hypothetical protein